MTTDRLVARDVGVGGAVGPTTTMAQRRTVAGVCHCGQELDICSRTHCPRCGSSVALRRSA